jgi:hypothetical protein
MKHNKEHIIDLFKRGFTPAEVVKKSGVSKSYVYNIRSQHKAEIQGKTKAKPKAKVKVKSLTMSEIGLKDALAKARGEPPLTFNIATPISFTPTKSLDDMVNSPPHYTKGGIETIDFIEAKELNYHLGNVVKYITRSGHKGDKLKDLEKAQWYLNREINNLKK